MRTQVKQDTLAQQAGARFRAVRRYMGMNQHEMASFMNVTRGAIAKWESGILTVQPRSALKLHRHGITLDYIFDGDASALPADVLCGLLGRPKKPAKKMRRPSRRPDNGDKPTNPPDSSKEKDGEIKENIKRIAMKFLKGAIAHGIDRLIGKVLDIISNILSRHYVKNLAEQ